MAEIFEKKTHKKTLENPIFYTGSYGDPPFRNQNCGLHQSWPKLDLEPKIHDLGTFLAFFWRDTMPIVCICSLGSKYAYIILLKNTTQIPLRKSSLFFMLVQCLLKFLISGSSYVWWLRKSWTSTWFFEFVYESKVFGYCVPFLGIKRVFVSKFHGPGC